MKEDRTNGRGRDWLGKVSLGRMIYPSVVHTSQVAVLPSMPTSEVLSPPGATPTSVAMPAATGSFTVLSQVSVGLRRHILVLTFRIYT